MYLNIVHRVYKDKLQPSDSGVSSAVELNVVTPVVDGVVIDVESLPPAVVGRREEYLIVGHLSPPPRPESCQDFDYCSLEEKKEGDRA